MGVAMSEIVELATEVDPEVGLEEYVWANHGRAIYKEWWWARWKRLRKDVVAGQESIERFVKASWWDWSDGSRPAHWRWP
mmetsp:Transcript_6843/g.10396  ORF Transcript_6843/g.10396 Transcript_6843/m.10396 type:complete len:80 (-) Transcript_6843:3585-3824(-)